MSELAQLIADLELTRNMMVQNLLEVRAMYEQAEPIAPPADSEGGNHSHLQQLLSAAVHELKDIEEQLHDARLHRTASPGTAQPPTLEI